MFTKLNVEFCFSRHGDLQSVKQSPFATIQPARKKVKSFSQALQSPFTAKHSPNANTHFYHLRGFLLSDRKCARIRLEESATHTHPPCIQAKKW